MYHLCENKYNRYLQISVTVGDFLILIFSSIGFHCFSSIIAGSAQGCSSPDAKMA